VVGACGSGFLTHSRGRLLERDEELNGSLLAFHRALEIAHWLEFTPPDLTLTSTFSSLLPASVNVMMPSIPLSAPFFSTPQWAWHRREPTPTTGTDSDPLASEPSAEHPRPRSAD
jgi:hypothetical protein